MRWLCVDDLGLIESNEASAAQICALKKEPSLNPISVNQNASASHLVIRQGATSSIFAVKTAHQRPLCTERVEISIGQGIAAIVERT